jgi:glutamate 5-kinase
MINKKLYIIKYGSKTLIKENQKGKNQIDEKIIKLHGKIISQINSPVIIVSSGAVAFGKIGVDLSKIENKTISKRLYAAYGNPELTNLWRKSLQPKKVFQALITHRDLKQSTPKQSIQNIIHELYKNSNENIIQINDNDFITDEELKELRGGEFSDNDELVALLTLLCSRIFKNIEIIINTSSDGVMENGNIISEIKNKNINQKWIQKICTNKTEIGTGGMNKKLTIINNLLKKNKKVIVKIINGKKPKMLEQIISGQKTGTIIKN